MLAAVAPGWAISGWPTPSHAADSSSPPTRGNPARQEKDRGIPVGRESGPSSPRRLALVIGNGAYRGAPLPNPANDAADMAAKLAELGFQVTPLLDATQREMEEAVNRLTATLRGGNSVGLFYFAGHGVPVEGENYLIPIGAEIEYQAEVRYKAVAAGLILDGMRQASNALNLVILDACRNNPYKRRFRGAEDGLTEMKPPRGTLILYATEPDMPAEDGNWRNSPFTAALLKALDEPGLSIYRLIERTTLSVHTATGGKQTPYHEGSLLRQFYFRDPPAKGLATAPAAASAPLAPSPTGTPSGTDTASAGSRPASDQTLVMQRSILQPQMTRLPSGCFDMGSPPEENWRDDDERRHRVCVDAFALGKHEVRVDAFRRFVEASGYQTDAERGVGDQDGCLRKPGPKEGWQWSPEADWRVDWQGRPARDDHPVTCVSLNDAGAFIDWLNAQTAGGYRLPTEAEWEYAARAGTETPYFWGINPTQACQYANVADQSYWGDSWSRNRGWGSAASGLELKCNDLYGSISPVASYEPNPWGLHDMLGNVNEWTCSAFNANYGGREGTCAELNLVAPRTVRGGAWHNDRVPTLRLTSFDVLGGLIRGARSAARRGNAAHFRSQELGFRLAADASESAAIANPTPYPSTAAAAQDGLSRPGGTSSGVYGEDGSGPMPAGRRTPAITGCRAERQAQTQDRIELIGAGGVPRMLGTSYELDRNNPGTHADRIAFLLLQKGDLQRREGILPLGGLRFDVLPGRPLGPSFSDQINRFRNCIPETLRFGFGLQNLPD